MSSYYEFDLVGTSDRYSIDLAGGGGYLAEGRSGRPSSVPHSLTITLTGYRLRVGAQGSTFYNPRLLVNVRGGSGGYAGGVIEQAGGFGLSSGYTSSIMLTGRTTDTATQNTDSSSANWSVVVPLRNSSGGVEIPSSVEFKVACGGIEKEVLIAGTPPFLSGTATAIRAVASDILVRNSRSASMLDGVEVICDFPFDGAVDMNGEFGGSMMYLFGTGANGTGFPTAAAGGLAIVGLTGDITSSWVAESHQRGSAYAIFYSTNDDFAERIDYVVGDVVVPDNADLPPNLKTPISGFLTFRSILVLPRVDELGVPVAAPPFPAFPSARRSILVPLLTHSSTTQFAGVVEIAYG